MGFNSRDFEGNGGKVEGIGQSLLPAICVCFPLFSGLRNRSKNQATAARLHLILRLS